LDFAHILIINASVLLILFAALWLYALRIRDVSFIDGFWALGIVVMAISTWVQSSPNSPRASFLLVLTALWGIRLGVHLLTRWRAHGIDPRYAKMLGRTMDKKGWSFGRTTLLQVFLLQAPLLFIVSLPAQLGQLGPPNASIGMLGWVGVVVALVGIAFESIGDAQLKAFRANAANRGKVLDTGLWRYTRHPNYFGDCCTWWGLFIVAVEGPLGIWSIAGPALLTFLLRKWSGVPLLEYSLNKSRTGYADYVRRTSSFIPLPPRKQ
jgi:steroid 5-alpha reductase family enzyme